MVLALKQVIFAEQVSTYIYSFFLSYDKTTFYAQYGGAEGFSPNIQLQITQMLRTHVSALCSMMADKRRTHFYPSAGLISIRGQRCTHGSFSPPWVSGLYPSVVDLFNGSFLT